MLEVDIRSFFDELDHGHLRTFLDRRVRDGVIRRVIGKWLQAGVLEEGRLRHPVTGTPQGGVISPLLANIYLHEVVDRWFEEEVKPRLDGRAVLIRYADDLVIAFASERDARRVQEALPKRLARFGLGTEQLLSSGHTRMEAVAEPTVAEGEDDLGAIQPPLDQLSAASAPDRPCHLRGCLESHV